MRQSKAAPPLRTASSTPTRHATITTPPLQSPLINDHQVVIVINTSMVRLPVPKDSLLTNLDDEISRITIEIENIISMAHGIYNSLSKAVRTELSNKNKAQKQEEKEKATVDKDNRKNPNREKTPAQEARVKRERDLKRRKDDVFIGYVH